MAKKFHSLIHTIPYKVDTRMKGGLTFVFDWGKNRLDKFFQTKIDFFEALQVVDNSH